MIPPDAQRLMSQRANATVVETAASHAVYVSQPEAVAAIIETAVKGVAKAGGHAQLRAGERLVWPASRRAAR